MTVLILVIVSAAFVVGTTLGDILREVQAIRRRLEGAR